MDREVFICHSSRDREAAKAVCETLEAAGVRCWVAPRNIPPGANYGRSIVEAIDSCRVLVLILSATSNESVHVLREVERALNRKVVRIIPLRIEDVMPSRDLEYFVSACHWFDAFPPPVSAHTPRLAAFLQRLLEKSGPIREAPAPPGNDLPPEPEPGSGRTLAVGLTLVGVCVLIAAVVLWRIRPPAHKDLALAPTPTPASTPPAASTAPASKPSTPAEPAPATTAKPTVAEPGPSKRTEGPAEKAEGPPPSQPKTPAVVAVPNPLAADVATKAANPKAPDPATAVAKPTARPVETAEVKRAEPPAGQPETPRREPPPTGTNAPVVPVPDAGAPSASDAKDLRRPAEAEAVGPSVEKTAQAVKLALVPRARIEEPPPGFRFRQPTRRFKLRATATSLDGEPVTGIEIRVNRQAVPEDGRDVQNEWSESARKRTRSQWIVLEEGENTIVAVAKNRHGSGPETVVTGVFSYVPLQPPRINVARRNPYLGLSPDRKKSFGTGVYLWGPHLDSPAEKAGIKASDRLDRFNGVPIRSWSDYKAALGLCQPGQVVRLDIVRVTTPMSFTVAVGVGNED